MNAASDFAGLPGSDLALRGLDDLAHGNLSEFSLLILIARPRLSRLGISMTNTLVGVKEPFEHALYSFLEKKFPEDAYSRYNSLIRRIVSFERALEREQNSRANTPDIRPS